MILSYYLDAPLSPRLAATLAIIFDGMGVSGRIVPDAGFADLAYTATRPDGLPREGIWIRRSSEVGVPHADWVKRTLAGVPGTSPGTIEEDMVRAAEALLLGDLERQVETSPYGVPLLRSGSPEAHLLHEPWVSRAIDALGFHLERRIPRFRDRVGRWPEGKRGAILMTHDVDKPYLRPRPTFYRRRIENHLRAGSMAKATRAAAGWVRSRIEQGPPRPPDQDPNFGWQFWKDLEQTLGGKGCFYVAVRSASDADGHPDDVPYDASDPEIVRAMRDAVQSGWEIGLHASITSAQVPGRLQEEKATLERLLGGMPVAGVRHHFWAMNPQAVHETWARHREAGFQYDSSLGVNDAPGFRRGLAWPFLPADPDGPGTGLLQIPPTLMDGGIFYHASERQQAEEAILAHVDQVLQVGGAAVLDWHLEQSNPERLRQAGPALVSALGRLQGRSDIWWTTPSEVVTWWNDRRERIRSAATGDPTSVGSPV